MREWESIGNHGMVVTTNPVKYIVPRGWRGCIECEVSFRKEPGWEREYRWAGRWRSVYLCACCAPDSKEAWRLFNKAEEDPK